jgi:lipopolysaccharide heptosyltransferase II
VRILLVRLRQIGDVVFTTPAVRALRERFPDAEVSYLVEPVAAPVVSHNPHIDHVIVAPRRRGLAGLAIDLVLARRLRARRFDLAIDFHGGPRAAMLTWLSGAPVRIGYEVVGRTWMYTRSVERPRALRARHSVENQWDLLRTLGVPPADPGAYPVEMRTASRPALDVAQRLLAAGVTAHDHLVVIHVSAGNPFRRWPVPSFAEVAASLAAGPAHARIVVTSGPSEREAAARVSADARRRLPAADRARILDCGEFSIDELRALVDRAALFIGGDSGPMHVAATSRVPIVALYGPTLPARSAPWREGRWPTEAVEVGGLACRPCDQRTCEPGDFRCLARIEPARVIEAAERAMSVSRGSGDLPVGAPC